MNKAEFAYETGTVVEFELTGEVCTVLKGYFGPYGNCYDVQFRNGGDVVNGVWESKLNPWNPTPAQAACEVG